MNIQSWKECEFCQAEISKHGLKDEHELQSYFNRRIEKFLQSKGKRLMGWDEMKIFYHMPPITGFVDKWVFTDSAVVDLKIPLPDMQVYYTLDGSTPIRSSNLYSIPVVIKKSGKFRARAFRKHHFSEIFESEFEKQTFRESVELHQPKQGIKQFYCQGRFEKAKDVNTAKCSRQRPGI